MAVSCLTARSTSARKGRRPPSPESDLRQSLMERRGAMIRMRLLIVALQIELREWFLQRKCHLGNRDLLAGVGDHDVGHRNGGQRVTRSQQARNRQGSGGLTLRADPERPQRRRFAREGGQSLRSAPAHKVLPVSARRSHPAGVAPSPHEGVIVALNTMQQATHGCGRIRRHHPARL